VQTVGMKTSWMDKKNLAVGAVSGRRLFGKSNRALLFRVSDTINQLSILCTEANITSSDLYLHSTLELRETEIHPADSNNPHS